MRYYKIINAGYLVAVGNGSGGQEITAEEHSNLLEIIHNKPAAESGYEYRLKTDLTWELYELPASEDPVDEIPLEAMTTAELKTIMADKGIATTMTKDNMVTLIKATE